MKQQRSNIIKLIFLSLLIASLIIFFLHNPTLIIAQIILLASIITLFLAPFILLSFLQRLATTLISIGFVSGSIGIKLINLNTDFGSIGELVITNHSAISICSFILAGICLYFHRENTKSVKQDFVNIQKELQTAVSKINRIKSSNPFVEKPEGFIPSAIDIFNATLAAHNNYAKVFDDYSQYIPPTNSSELEVLKQEIDNKVGTIGAIAFLQQRNMSTEKSIQPEDLKELMAKISEFNSQAIKIFSDELQCLNKKV